MTSGHISAPLFDLFDPVPYQGHSATTRAASASGARRALDGRATKLARLRSLYAVPRTMQDMSAITGWPISSVCSLTARLKALGEIEEAGTATGMFTGGRATTRTQWRRRS
jgi:hypothetical protein